MKYSTKIKRFEQWFKENGFKCTHKSVLFNHYEFVKDDVTYKIFDNEVYISRSELFNLDDILKVFKETT